MKCGLCWRRSLAQSLTVLAPSNAWLASRHFPLCTDALMLEPL